MQHLAAIMSGNRRWAAKNNVLSGHQYGLEAVKRIIKFCLDRGIKYLSLYTLSTENLRRLPEIEIDFLLTLFENRFAKELPEFIKNQVRIRFIGDRSLFPERSRHVIQTLEDATKECGALTVNLLFCYGARAEITDTVKRIAQQVQSGAISIDQINEKTIHSSLWTDGIPDPELIIRTGKDSRLSNFLLLQAAYSELMFLDAYWPEVDEALLDDCLKRFEAIKPNFGA